MNTKPKNTIPSLLAVAAVVSLPAVAAAQHAPQHEDRPVGIGVSAGAGVTGFSDDETSDIVGAGGTWEARVTFGTRSALALEAAYIGSLQQLDLLVDELDLIGSGLEGALRLNLGASAVQPYVVGGMGWMHYTLRRGDREIDLRTDDDVLTIPAGAGIAFHAGGALVDLRATYRFAFDDELLRDSGEFEDRESLDTWAATARVGVEF